MRILSLSLALMVSFAFVGCDNTEEPSGDAATDNAAVTDGATPSDGSGGGGNFKEGVDSGRAEDGSDEHK